MRELYWRTNGRFNDLAAFILCLLNRPDTLDNRPGILGVPDEIEVRKAVRDLRTHGYHVFNRRVPDSVCEELLAFAKTTAARPLVGSSDNLTGFKFDWGDPVVFDEMNSRHVVYHFDAQKVMETSSGQKIVSEPYLHRMAQDYLRCRPVVDLVAMWWSTAALKKASSEAAQLYHFDMDWIKFVKFFVYLTDVTEDTGPHCYVAGSHVRKPKALLRDGRFLDEEIKPHYPQENFIKITGPKGTMFVADTRGFHKGLPPLSGSRLIFQVEFAVSLFGANYPPIEVNGALAPEFIETIRRHPYTFTKFIKPGRQ
ncbi:MAG: phytanoyl-CoA dioxygenase family protein [Deltaproteobacteria bacterium]|nr:phytanoyl-CoA dioxygenase family protein [Deltaproteobacteria bacterium]